jgi:CRISPR/Cas system-associated exonuclease Cas4 (RecB family)
MKCEYLSASSASTYEQCPLRYYAKYELGKKSGSTVEIGAGLLAHKVLELFYRPGNEQSKEVCFEEASKLEACLDFEQFKEAKNMAFDLINEEPRESTNTITTELNFEFFLESGAAGRGFIDRIDLINDKTIGIVDYKSGNFVPSMEELATGHQANIYAAYVFLEDKFSGIENVMFTFKYIRTGQQKLIKINRKQTDEYLPYFEHIYHSIKNNNNPKPTMNQFCWNCEHRSECPEYLNAIGIIFSIRSACGLGCGKIDSTDGLQELTASELVEVFNSVSTMTGCLDKEKKLVSSWMTSMIQNTGDGKIESDKSIAKLTSRKVTSVDGRNAKILVKKFDLVDKALELLSAGDLEKLIKGNAEARSDYEKIITQRDGAMYPTVSKKKG